MLSRIYLVALVTKVSLVFFLLAANKHFGFRLERSCYLFYRQLLERPENLSLPRLGQRPVPLPALGSGPRRPSKGKKFAGRRNGSTGRRKVSSHGDKIVLAALQYCFNIYIQKTAGSFSKAGFSLTSVNQVYLGVFLS